VAFLVRIGHLGNAHWVDVRNNDRAAYVGRRDAVWGRPQVTAWPLRTAMDKLAAFVGSRKDRSLSTPRRPAQRRQGVRSETMGSFSERSG
jgi:hypothetical protein